MENKIIKISKFLTIIGICGIIYLLNSILLGLNTLNALQAETRDSTRAICNALNYDELAHYKCNSFLK